MDLPHGARVLLIRLSALGDVLFALEALASLVRERPDVTVDFMVEDRFAGLLSGHPQIDEVLVFPRRQRRALPGWVRRLRRRRYDAVLDLQGNLKSAVHARLARTPRRLGYAPPIAREGAHWLYDQAVRLPEPRPHRAEQGAFLLRALGLAAEPTRPVLAPPPPGIDVPGADVILHPGTSAFAAFKRWPASRFAELGRRLLARGLRVGVTHGPGEEDLARAAAHGVAGIEIIDGGSLGLAGLGAVLGRARVVVAGDTGPLHLAAAAGSRVVALMGPKDPALYGPRGDGHRALFASVPCRPCRRRSCASPQCLLGLHVDEVEAAIDRALDPASANLP